MTRKRNPILINVIIDTLEQKKALKILAEKEGRSVSNYVKKLIVKNLGEKNAI